MKPIHPHANAEKSTREVRTPGNSQIVEFSFSTLIQLRDRNRILGDLRERTGGAFVFACVVLDRSGGVLHWMEDEDHLGVSVSLEVDRMNGVWAALMSEGEPAVVRHFTQHQCYYYPLAVCGSPLGLIQVGRIDGGPIHGREFRLLTEHLRAQQEDWVRLFQGFRYTVQGKKM